MSTAVQEKLLAELPSIVEEAKYDELWGHQLTLGGPFYDANVTKVILAKFVKANEDDFEKAKLQLLNTLKWRKEFNPLKAAFVEKHDPKFDNAVVVAKYEKAVVTWNLYNADNKVKPKDLFTDVDAFLRFRSGSMERGLQLLDFSDEEHSTLIQVHDYEGVSFLRFDPDIKKGSRATIKLFQDNYPELLRQKFFVNVPYLMSWVYGFVTTWLKKQTTKKFFMLSNAPELVGYLGKEIPNKYGGTGGTLSEQMITEIKQTKYTEYLLQQEEVNEID